MAAANQRMAGLSPGVQALGHAAVLTGAVPGLYSAYDLFTGGTHGLNSGEIPLNALIGLLPVATAMGGAAMAQVMSPAARLAQEAELMQVMRSAGVEPSPELKKKFSERAAAQVAQMQGKAKEGMSQAEALQRLRNRGTAIGTLGTMAGSLAGAVPAIMMMRDQPLEKGAG
jgi:hypothetical protein